MRKWDLVVMVMEEDENEEEGPGMVTVSPRKLNGGGCPIGMEMDCTASRGPSNFYRDCLGRERELALG